MADRVSRPKIYLYRISIIQPIFNYLNTAYTFDIKLSSLIPLFPVKKSFLPQFCRPGTVFKLQFRILDAHSGMGRH
mgnify:CR=1 FL=1